MSTISEGDSQVEVEEGKKEEEKKDKKMKFDEFLFSHLGEMGKYQKIQVRCCITKWVFPQILFRRLLYVEDTVLLIHFLQFTLVCLPTIFCAMHALSWTFAGAQIAHR